MDSELREVRETIANNLAYWHQVAKNESGQDTTERWLIRAAQILNTPITIAGGICPECKGNTTISIWEIYDSVYGHFVEKPCPTCKGTGKPDKTFTVREAIERMMK